MKNHLIISLLFLSVGFCQQEYNINDINKRSGVSYKKFSDERVNGNVYQMFGDMKVDLGKLKDGKKDGLWNEWYENGQKKGRGTFKDGETISQECWDEDGNECECGYYGCK